jgi:hypothetical protein
LRIQTPHVTGPASLSAIGAAGQFQRKLDLAVVITFM